MKKYKTEQFGLLDGLPDVVPSLHSTDQEWHPVEDNRAIDELEGFPVRYESTYLNFTRKPTVDEAKGVMYALVHMQTKSPLYLGDAADLLELMYGEMWTQFIPEGIEEKTIVNLRAICRNCPPTMRHENLLSGHYGAAGGVKPIEKREEFLEACHKEGWTVHEARKRKGLWMGKKPKTKEKANIEVIKSCVDRIYAYFQHPTTILPPDTVDAIQVLAEEVKKL